MLNSIFTRVLFKSRFLKLLLLRRWPYPTIVGEREHVPCIVYTNKLKWSMLQHSPSQLHIRRAWHVRLQIYVRACVCTYICGSFLLHQFPRAACANWDKTEMIAALSRYCFKCFVPFCVLFGVFYSFTSECRIA